VTDTNENGRRAERDANCDVAVASNSLHTSIAYIARFSSTLLRFGSVVNWLAGVCFTLEVSEYFIHQLSGLPVSNLAPATFTFRVLMHQLKI
jgi:hypothetical protein